MRTFLIWPVLLILLPYAAMAESEITNPLLGSGSGSVSTPDHSLQYTIGQPVVGSVGTAVHQLDAGFWSATPTVTAIGPDVPSASPVVDRLRPNVPNPFNPATTIAYDLAFGGPVRLSVYDLAGRVVARLLDEHQNAGQHSQTWRGVASNGSSVASGVYIFVLDTPRSHFTQKAVLLK